MTRQILWFGVLLLACGCATWRGDKGYSDQPSGDVLQAIPAAQQGAAVAVPVRVAGGAAVALQFDLVFDAAALELESGATTAAGARRAGKELTVRPVSRGVARVVVYGANLAILPQGELGTIQFRAVRQVTDSKLLAVNRATPDADGHELPSTVRSGVIAIGTGGT